MAHTPLDLISTLTRPQADHLREWAQAADVRAAGITSDPVPGTLHVLVHRADPVGPPGGWWTDRIAVPNGISCYSSLTDGVFFGAPDPLRAARELVERIAASGGFVADGLLTQLSPPAGADAA